VKALGQGQAEAIEEGGLILIGTHHTAQAQLAARLIGQRQDHIGAEDVVQLVENRARTVAQAGPGLPLLQGLP